MGMTRNGFVSGGDYTGIILLREGDSQYSTIGPDTSSETGESPLATPWPLLHPRGMRTLARLGTGRLRDHSSTQCREHD